MQKHDLEEEDICAVSLRPATSADEEFLRQLFATTRADELALMPWGEDQKQTFISMQFKAQSQQYAMTYPNADNSIILFNEAPIGRMMVARTEAAILLVDIAVLPEHRNAGIGTNLIQDLLRAAAAVGKPVRLHVFAASAARRLYERLGFSRIGLDTAYFEMLWVPPVSQS
ncbi:MAG: GNAT family N-acetyltransferase [Pyrinomonadaceae bacterium]